MQVEQMARSMGFEVRASGFQSQRHDLLTGPPGARDSAPLPVLLAAPREVNATVEPPCAAQRLAGGAQRSNPTGKGVLLSSPVLQMGKLRHSRGKRFAQGPT